LLSESLDLGAGAAVDPVGVVDEVDDRTRLDRLVENDREVARVGGGRLRVPRDARWSALQPALGDGLGDVRELLPSLVGEAEGDVRLVELVEVRLRVRDVGA